LKDRRKKERWGKSKERGGGGDVYLRKRGRMHGFIIGECGRIDK
jgi:hypothetical protein